MKKQKDIKFMCTCTEPRPCSHEREAIARIKRHRTGKIPKNYFVKLT